MLQVLSDEVKDEDPGADVSEPSGPSQTTISLLSPKAMEMAGRIIKFEEEKREKAKVRLGLFSDLDSHQVAFTALVV